MNRAVLGTPEPLGAPFSFSLSTMFHMSLSLLLIIFSTPVSPISLHHHTYGPSSLGLYPRIQWSSVWVEIGHKVHKVRDRVWCLIIYLTLVPVLSLIHSRHQHLLDVSKNFEPGVAPKRRQSGNTRPSQNSACLWH